MTSPGHDGEHGGAMDKIKSVWREAIGARDDHHDGGADNGQGRGGQHAPPGAPPRVARPGHPGPAPQQQNTPHVMPQVLPRSATTPEQTIAAAPPWGPAPEGEQDVRPAPEQPTAAQAVPWQAPRPMAQPGGPQQINPQQMNPRPLPQRSGPPPVAQPVPQWTAPQPVAQPLPQRPMAPPTPLPVTQEAWIPPPPAPAPADEVEREEPPTTLQPVARAAVDDRTEAAPGSTPAEADPATADLTGQGPAAPVQEPEAAHELDDEVEDEADEESDEPIAEGPPGRPSDATPPRPVEPIRPSVWTEPEPAAPPPPTEADTPDRPMPAYSPVPAAPQRTPDRVPSTLPSHIPSHITDAAVGTWTRPQNGATSRPRGRHELFDAPNREAESMPDPAPSAPSRPAAAETPATDPQRFVAQDRAAAYADRWGAVKSEFVDEPREAVRKADALVGELLAEIARGLAEQRAQLDRGLDTDATSTEDLRQAMHRYREFFDRLLIL